MQGSNERRPRRLLARLGLALALVACAAIIGPASASALQAVAPDGSVFVAWDDVEVTRIEPDGTPTGIVYDIAPEPQYPAGPDQTENSHLVDMAVAPDGVVTLIWLDIVSWDARIMTRRLAPDGTPLGEPVEIAADQEIHITPQLGVGPDGTATVVWSRLVSPGDEVVMRRLDPDGAPEDGVEVLSTPGNSAYGEVMAMDADGTVTVVWTEKGEGESDLVLERKVAPDGTPEATHQLGSSDWAIGGAQVEVAADGTAVVLWDQWPLHDDHELWTRQIEPDGSPQPTAHLLDADERITFAGFALAADGTALATWAIGWGDGWLGSFIAPNGTPADAVPLTAGGSPLDEWPGVTPMPDHGFMLNWLATCGSKACLRVGEIDEEGDVAEPVTLDEGGILGRGGGIFLPDGTGNYVWGKAFTRNGDHGFVRTRRIAPDLTLGPIHNLFEPDQEPLINSFLDEVDFGEVPVGSSLNFAVPVFVKSIDPLGTFSASIAGPDADRFRIADGGTCGPEDTHPTNCLVMVAFEPSAAGSVTASLVLEAGEGTPLTIPLIGEGIAPPPGPNSTLGAGPSIGKPQPDSSTGTAALSIGVPGAGLLRIIGPCVGGSAAARSAKTEGAAVVELKVVAKSHCRRQLLRIGTTRFGVIATFTPSGGDMTVAHRPVRLRLASR